MRLDESGLIVSQGNVAESKNQGLSAGVKVIEG